ncbi:MAG TPA: oxygenase MpaB family protein [Vicinamibacterales bacterium]|nr:oxygenase MpaB family protein [Vicinamibacterales bacterium]
MKSPSPARRINAERIVLFGWGRAILLQLAHPLIAAGVHDHSGFRATPWAAVTRLYHTVHAMLALTFGAPPAYEQALEGIRAIHRRVNGVLPEQAGPFDAGTRYSAEDPDLVLWVHATLLESLPLTYELLVGPLTDQERDAYCEEAATVAIALCARDGDVPRTWEATRRYMDRMRASGVIAVSSQAHALAHSVLYPPAGWLFGPAASINRIVTAGLLPADLREQYGLRWTQRSQRAFDAIVPMMRTTRRVLPASLALWPEARRSD